MNMIEVGLKHVSELKVTDAFTAITAGSGDMPVLPQFLQSDPAAWL